MSTVEEFLENRIFFYLGWKTTPILFSCTKTDF